VNDKTWLKSEPGEAPLTGLVAAMVDGSDDPNVVSRIHHFLLPAEGWGAAADSKEVKDQTGEAQKELKAWRTKVKAKPSKTQLDRLVALGSRAESLWQLTLRRLQVAEAEARREIDYFGKSTQPVVVANSVVDPVETNDENGSYQRLRRVMDAWNALWFWPLTERATGGVQPPSLDEWISGLEGILGIEASAGKASRKYGHVEGQTSVLSMASWGELEAIESFDHSTSQVKPIGTVRVAHRWLDVCERVARDQGFFHWELDFASVFGRGGFDLQVGNPPWVRPDWDENAVYAEFDPWWQLNDKQTQAAKTVKQLEAKANVAHREFMANQASGIEAVRAILTSSATYPIVSGLRPDLYRSFMERTWRSMSAHGIVALLHPESHFTEKKAAHLRAETYRRLRRHWQFINELSLFEIHHLVTYGVHVYGARNESPKFKMAASLYHPDTVSRSEVHNGLGEVPGLKDTEGNWDTRPHAERIIEVDESVLAVWADILDEPGTPPTHARMVYPVNRESSRVLKKLSKAPKVRELGLQYSSGWNETTDRKKGFFEVGSAVPASWKDVIVQGPHFTVANPFAKEPNPTMKNNLDWTEVDLEAIPAEFIPRTSYQPQAGVSQYQAGYGVWSSSGNERISARSTVRLMWRNMAAVTGARTLHMSLLPRGAAHVHTVNSGGFPEGSNFRTLMALGGFGASIVADFQIKVAGASKIGGDDINLLPMALTSSIADELARRFMLLTCLTNAYADVWQASCLFDFEWSAHHPVRRAAERRRTQIELDVLAAQMVGVSVDELCTIYRTQFPVLRGYERNDLYDANGRKVPGEMNRLYRKIGESLTLEERTWAHPQSGIEYVFEFPFQSFDREEDMRKAYAHFSSMLGENP
jgi:hypothetical protein